MRIAGWVVVLIGVVWLVVLFPWILLIVAVLIGIEMATSR